MSAPSKLPAVSAFAPAGRNVFMESSSPASSSSSSSSSRKKKTLAVGALLILVRYWKQLRLLASPRVVLHLILWQLRELPETLQPVFQSLREWIQQLLDGLLLRIADRPASSSSSAPSSPTPLRMQHMNGRAIVTPRSTDTATTATETTSAERAGRFYENQQLIHQVLHYWFGQYTPDQSQKKLWMVVSDHQRIVDKEIYDKFAPLLLELVGPTDSTRRSEWCGWIDDDESASYEHNVYGYQGKLAAILVLDQFSRHIQRHIQQQSSTIKEGKSSTPVLNTPEQSTCDELALHTAQLFVDAHEAELECGMIPPQMYVFALMPFRHTNRKESVGFVQDQIEQMATMHREYDALIRRFRKATNRRLAVLQDEARRTGDGSINGDHSFTDQDILECESFQADMSMSATHIVHQTICAFLADRDILPNRGDTTPRSCAVMPIIVSLSGGVDSMVIVRVLSHLAKHCGYPIRVTAIHIDYANRPESAAEANFVRRYCQQLGIAFDVRRIDQVTRGVTARDEYETNSRQVRYGFYRQTVSQCKEEMGDEDGDANVGVVLGHHRGDLRENVLSNAHKGCGPLDLSGMTSVSTNDGVTLYRPLLTLEKTAIYDYAHVFGVPYFKDTTPHWSTRGQLRNKLLPLLEEIYGEGSMNNLSNLAVESDECRALLHEVSLGPFLEQVERKPMGITFATAEWKYQSLFFWKFVLREALHSAGIGMFTDKSVVSFLERIRAFKPREGWLQCRKDCGVYLRQDGRVYVLFASSFPWRIADSYNCEGDIVEYGAQNSVIVGPWRVTARAQLIPVFDGGELKERIETKAVRSMDAFMDGSIEYYLKARSWQAKDGSFEPRPLVFTSFTKTTRPRAWKNTNVKLQEKLPLLGNDDKALAALKDPIGCGAVHEDADGCLVANPVLLVKVSLRLVDTYPESP